MPVAGLCLCAPCACDAFCQVLLNAGIDKADTLILEGASGSGGSTRVWECDAQVLSSLLQVILPDSNAQLCMAPAADMQ